MRCNFCVVSAPVPRNKEPSNAVFVWQQMLRPQFQGMNIGKPPSHGSNDYRKKGENEINMLVSRTPQLFLNKEPKRAAPPNKMMPCTSSNSDCSSSGCAAFFKGEKHRQR